MFLNKLQHIIKRRDMFGHKVELNFNEKHRAHKTLIGGCLSIFINIALFSLILAKTITMVAR